MKSVSHNTILYTGASIIQKALSFVYYWIIARTFGPEGAGQYSYALAFAALFSILIDGGLTPVLIRTCAQPNQNSRAWLKRVLRYKAYISAITALVMLTVVLWISGRALSVWPLIFVAGLTMLMDTVNTTVYGVLRAEQLLKYESAGLILSQFAVLLCGIVVLFGHLPVVAAVIALSIGSVVHGIIGVTGLMRVAHIVEVDNTTIAPVPSGTDMAKQAAPFALAGIFARTYSFFDSFYLAEMSRTGFTGVGVYSTANKITFAFQFIPLALVASLYPAFVHATDAAARARLWINSQRYVMLCAGGIVAVLISVRVPLLNLFGAGFQAGSTVLFILAISLPFSFMSYPNGALLNALHLSRLQTTAMGLTVMVNVLANVLLVGNYGVIGASVAALCGNATLWAVGAYYAHSRAAEISLNSFASIAVRVVGACAVAAVVGSFFSHGTGVITPLIFGGIAALGAYLCCIIILKVLSVNELTQLLEPMRARV